MHEKIANLFHDVRFQEQRTVFAAEKRHSCGKYLAMNVFTSLMIRHIVCAINPFSLSAKKGNTENETFLSLSLS